METELGKVSTKSKNTLLILTLVLSTVSAIAVTVSALVEIKHYRMLNKEKGNA